MKKKTIVILSVIIVCCIVVMLCGCSKAGEESGTASDATYSGGNNLLVGTMLPNLPSVTWEGETVINGDETTSQVHSQEIMGTVSGQSDTATASLNFGVVKNSDLVYAVFSMFFTDGLNYIPNDCSVSFSRGDEYYKYVANVVIPWVGPVMVNITCEDENIANLFKNSTDDQEIQIRVVDNVTNNYIEFNLLKGNFDEVYYTEEIQ